MKNFILMLILLLCAGCGSSDDVTFEGTWSGSLPLIGNDCPFSAPQDQNQIFPVVISALPDNQLNVVGADGSSGGGVQDDDSFRVAGPPFGSPVLDTGIYTGCTVSYNFGFYTAHDSEAESELLINFDNCIDSTDGSTESCGILYAGEASKLN